MTITNRSTRAEIKAAYEAAVAEREALRQTVVTKALAQAKRHGWCSVVQDTLREVGLGDLLPPSFVVQRQYRSGNKWVDQYTENSLTAAKRVVRNEIADKTPSGASAIWLPAVHLTQLNVNDVLERVQRHKRDLTPVANPTPPKFPAFRVVRRQATDEVVLTEADL